MSKFNTTATKPARGTGPIVATGPALTHEGGQGYSRNVKSELFLLAVSNFVGENSFYEKADERDARYQALVRQAAVADPQWTSAFLAWLRSEANMRSASLVGALEAAKAMLEAKVPGARPMVASVLQRADEPGEALAYWTSRYGRAVPKPVKRGIADAVARLYTEYALLKYDTNSKGFRFADVLDLTHPAPAAPWQGGLFVHALERRHGRAAPIDRDVLPMLAANEELRREAMGDPSALLNADRLREAGMTWEDVLSLAGAKLDKAKLWEAVIPSMGYMALLRNLRNFDEAGVRDGVAHDVMAKLTDPAQVARSRQFPYRFLAAYEQAPSLRWAHPLEVALNHALANVPVLDGRSLVLIDTSASMTGTGFSARSKMTSAKAAAVFGVTLAIRCGADVYGFADGVFRHDVPKGASALREIERFVARTGEVGHGTAIAAAAASTWRGHDRLFIVSDMQTMDRGVSTALPPTVAMYGFNLGGYRTTAVDAGATNRIEFGGLTDATLRMLPLIEAGRNATWPWEHQP